MRVPLECNKLWRLYLVDWIAPVAGLVADDLIDDDGRVGEISTLGVGYGTRVPRGSLGVGTVALAGGGVLARIESENLDL